MHPTVHSSIIYNCQDMEATQVSNSGWINKMWSIHTMEYYSALKKKEILTQAVTWVDLEDTVLSE